MVTSRLPAAPPAREAPRARVFRAAILLAGLIGPQVILFGPSLIGRKILLPLDVLGARNYYLPATPEFAGVQPHDIVLSDEVLLFEFERRFTAEEFRAGRLPLWNPHIYLGAPFVVWGKYAPFNAVYCLLPSPYTLAWLQLLKTVVAGVGAFWFFRRVLGVGYWPAGLGAWCYPLTGFFVLWQGYPQSEVTAWFPWVLVATHAVVQRPLGAAGPALAVLTAFVLLTRVDLGIQVLLTAGLFALWCLWDEYRWRRDLPRTAGAGAALAATSGLGLLLAAPYLLPLAEYVGSGDRMVRRSAGQEERPPGGLFELPRLVLPEVYGATHHGSHLVVPGNLLESGAAGYTGLLATLVLAPLAWCSRRHRSVNRFWVVLAVLALGWTLNVPGLVSLLRAPGLNLLSHNRFVFAAAFALLALAVVGFDVIGQGSPDRRWWFGLPVAAIVLLGVWCWDRSTWLPEPLATQLEHALAAEQPPPNIPDRAALEQARAHYRWAQTRGVLLCGAALCGWLLVWFGGAGRPLFRVLLGTALVGELLFFAYGRNPQCDPALYYPRLRALQRLAEAPPGRVLGLLCLPADLAMSHGLRDLRGYDSIDPRPVVELLDLVRDPRSAPSPYARLQWYVPLFAEGSPGELRLPPVLNMLGVRYLIFRGSPPPGVIPLLVEPDYWVVENPDALPRAFVPRRVERALDADHLLRSLGTPGFHPRDVAYVEGSVALPDDCRGTAVVVDEVPNRVTLQVDMETPGLLVLADLWFEGWQAYRDGQPVPILRTNHALRGVVLPPGRSTVEFRYQPASFTRGMQGFITGFVGWILWAGALGWYGRRKPSGATAWSSGGSHTNPTR